ncbi:MAG: hypothetical protein IPF65_13375, partial [Polaromonas sp.]|nr:hypothetical protein [Polaromonas sp.]
MLIRTLSPLVALTVGNFAMAQMTPVGTWQSIDDKTKEASRDCDHRYRWRFWEDDQVAAQN